MTYAGAVAEPIAIIGVGALMPKAADVAQFWANIVDGIDCIEDVPESRWPSDAYFDADPKARDRTYCKRGGFIPDIAFDPLEFGLPPHALEGTDTAQLLSLVVARSAFADAGYTVDGGADHSRTGVILGVAGTTMKTLAPLAARLEFPVWERALRQAGLDESAVQAALARLGDAYPDWDENSFPGYLASVVAGRIANRFNLGGTSFAVDAACASGLCAIRLACAELRARHCDLMLTGGVDTDNSILAYLSFSKTPALSPSQQIRPFDAACDGTLIAEGIGMLVLKRLVDAQAAQDRIYAVIRGIGAASDGRGSAITVPRLEGQLRAIHAALSESRRPAGDIGLIEAHGTGTQVGDRVELQALLQVYGDAADPGAPIALGSIKSQIGHTKAAAGAASLIKAALALHARLLPPTLHVGAPHPLIAGADAPLTLPRQARPWFSEDGSPRCAAVSAFGFGGANYHAILEAHDAPRSLSRRPARVPTGDVVAVFSGQGSHYVGMGSRLAIDHPAFYDAVAAMDGALVRAGAAACSRLMFPHHPRDPAEATAQHAALTRTLHAQAGVGAFNMGAWRLLEAAGLQPLCAIGHSFGELSALWAAGALSDAAYLRLVVARGQALSPPAGHDGGALLALQASASRAAAVLSALPGLSLANLNGPDQTVIGGPLAAVAAAEEWLAAADIVAVRLPVAAAFHTPCVEFARAAWQAALAGLTAERADIAVFANSTALPYPADIAATLAEQPFRPVQFQRQVQAAYAAGGRIFLEVGPKAHLTRLIGRILEGRPHTALAINPNPQADASRQLQQAIAQLRALGVDLPDPRPAAAAPSRPSPATVWIGAAGPVGQPARATLTHGAIMPETPPTSSTESLLAECHQAFLDGQVAIARAVLESGPVAPAALALLRDLQESGTRLHEQYLAGQAEISRAVPAQAAPVRFVAPPPVAQPAEPAPAAPPAVDELVRRIIAEKTGYPEDILLAGMNLEADLGIDSIKRIEILAAAAAALGIARDKGEGLRGALTVGGLTELLRGAPSPLMRVVAEALPPRPARGAPAGVILLADDGSPLGDALAASHPQVVRVALHADSKALEQAWRLAAAGGRIAGAVLVAPAADQAAALLALVGFLAPRLTSGALLAVTRLDGRLGLEGTAPPAAGSLYGIMKTARLEWPELAVRTLDIDPALPPAQALAALFTDWPDGSEPAELGISAAGRCTLTRAPVSAGRLRTVFSPEDVILVTGGGRGITALCAAALAREVPARIVLLGRTTLTAADPAWAAGAEDRALRGRAAAHLTGASPRDIAAACRAVEAGRALRHTLAALPGAEYLCCDLADPAAAAGLAPLAVTGIVHGAGVLADRRIEDVQPGDLGTVFGPKVDGLEHLLQAIDPARLRTVALFSSTAGFFGNAGQGIYAAANEVLNKRAYSLARQLPDARVIAFDWGPWQGGMVGGDVARRFAARGVRLLAPEVGTRVFLDLFLAGSPGGFQFVVGEDVGALPQTAPGAKPLNLANSARLPASSAPVLVAV